MKLVDIPAKFAVPFGTSAGANKRVIPTDSQIGIDDGAASLTTGFPPLNFLPQAAGGIPPFGQDFNGILFESTSWDQWFSAGGPIAYDSAFQALIGGYPLGTTVASAVLDGLYWRSTSDDNLTDPDAGGAGWIYAARVRLTEDTTFYLSATGSNSNSGLSALSPWATRAHAWTMLQNFYDLAGYDVLIQIADGNYVDSFNAAGPILGQASPDSIIFNGNDVTPSNVDFFPPTGNCWSARYQAMFEIRNLQIRSTSNGIVALMGGIIQVGTGVQFGTTTLISMASDTGGLINVTGNFTIATGGTSFMNALHAGQIRMVGFTGTVVGGGVYNFVSGFALVSECGMMITVGSSFVLASGTVTGPRAGGVLNGVILSGQVSQAAAFPGNSNGSFTTGAQFS